MQKSTIDFINKHIFDLVLTFLVVLNVLPFLAPIFAHWGWYWPAHIIYFIYSFLCHEFSYRSLHIFGYQNAWCARDTFIWGALLIVAIVAKFCSIKPIKWYWVIPFTVPIAFDGVIQTVATVLGFGNGNPWYMSTNLLRMLTGSFFGIGLGLWLLPNLKEIAEEGLKQTKQKLKQRTISNWILIPAIMIFLLIVYLVLVQIWQLTSPANPPANFLDWAVKTPATVDGWLQRGKDAI